MIGAAADLVPLFLDTAFGKTIFVFVIFAGAIGILFAPNAEYLIALALLPLLGWAVDVLGPHPMLAVIVFIAAGLGRSMMDIGDKFLEASAETQAMVLAFTDELFSTDGPDQREND